MMRIYPDGKPEDPNRCIATISARAARQYEDGSARMRVSPRQCLRSHDRDSHSYHERLRPFCWQHRIIAIPFMDGSFGGVHVPPDRSQAPIQDRAS